MNKTRLLACLFALALGASAAVAYPTTEPSDAGRRRPSPCVRDDAGKRRFSWHTIVEAMLPPALRARHETTSSDGCEIDSTFVAEELAAWARLARRAAGSLS